MRSEASTSLSRWGFGRSPRYQPQNPGVKLRVSVVLIRGDEILLIRHRRDGRFYWVLPGGGLESGERVAACAAREVREETGLDVKIPRLLYVCEVLSPSQKKHVLDLIFLGELAGSGQPLRPSRHWTIEEPRFIPLKDLPSVELYPPIAFEIMEDADDGWRGPIRFLGNLWVDPDPETATGPPRESGSPSSPGDPASRTGMGELLRETRRLRAEDDRVRRAFPCRSSVGTSYGMREVEETAW